jgi:hypothetical protein
MAEESTEEAKKDSGKHGRGRKFRGAKKSAQTDIYFIDREKIEWFKVG